MTLSLISLQIDFVTYCLKRYINDSFKKYLILQLLQNKKKKLSTVLISEKFIAKFILLNLFLPQRLHDNWNKKLKINNSKHK